VTIVSDDFNRANNTNLGANWAEDTGGWAISSNRVWQTTTGAVYRKLRWVGTALASADYAVQATVFTGSSAAVGSGVLCRAVTSATETFYCLVVFPANNGIHIIELTAGSGVILASAGPTLAINTSYTLRLECSGGTLRGYLDGVLQITTSDATLASGSPGIVCYGDQDATGAYTDSWSAWDLTNVLTVGNYTLGTPVLATPLLGQTHALTVAELATGTPTLATPLLGQAHALSPNGLASGTPTLATPALTQAHTLTIAELTTGAVAFAALLLEQRHALTPVDASAGAVSIAVPTLTQTHVLALSALATGVPVLDTPTLSIEGTMQAVGIVTGAPTLDAPALAQVHALNASALLADLPDLPTLVLGQAHVLLASALQAEAATLATPAIAQTHVLVATGIGVAPPGMPSQYLFQTHVLTVANLDTGMVALGLPTLYIVTGEINETHIFTVPAQVRRFTIGADSRRVDVVESMRFVTID
jgi:hypothetical protein